MEKLSPIDNLNLLEKKVNDLLGFYKAKCCEVVELNQKLADMANKVEMLETSVLNSSEEVDQERALAKMVVENLVSNIECAVKSDTGCEL